jgi:hypothetical protein
MATVLPLPTTRPGVTFELERLELDRARLIVGGRWTGVRGIRFVRPTLVVGGRQLLAALDHKPWPPDRVPWLAAFPWDGDSLDLAGVTLEVAPSVRLSLDTESAPATPGADARGGADADGDLAVQLQASRDALRAVTAERDALASTLLALLALLRSLGR